MAETSLAITVAGEYQYMYEINF